MSLSKYLSELTDEQRLELQQKRKESADREKQYAEDNLQLDYLDDSAWADLAKQYGVRLPIRYKAPSTKIVRKALRAIGKDVQWFKDVWGIKKVEDAWLMNPRLNARAVVGYTLEALLYNDILDQV